MAEKRGGYDNKFFVYLIAAFVVGIAFGYIILLSLNSPVYICQDGRKVSSAIDCSGLSDSNLLEKNISLANVIVSNSKLYYNSVTGREIDGEVQNLGNVRAQSVKIEARFFAEDGAFVGTSYTYSVINDLKPGQKSPFLLKVQNADINSKDHNFTSYNLNVSWS